MHADSTGNSMERLCLSHDNGPEIVFHGRLFAESSWYDEERSILTRQKLYVTDKNEQVYYIVSGNGPARERRAYKLFVEGDICTVFDGTTHMSLPLPMLMVAVRELCGLDDDSSFSLCMVEEMLKAANA